MVAVFVAFLFVAVVLVYVGIEEWKARRTAGDRRDMESSVRAGSPIEGTGKRPSL